MNQIPAWISLSSSPSSQVMAPISNRKLDSVSLDGMLTAILSSSELGQTSKSKSSAMFEAALTGARSATTCSNKDWCWVWSRHLATIDRSRRRAPRVTAVSPVLPRRGCVRSSVSLPRRRRAPSCSHYASAAWRLARHRSSHHQHGAAPPI